jgi:microcystin-dependent protein
MAGKVTDFSAITTPSNDDVFYIVQVSDNTDKKITVANAGAAFGATPSGAIMPFAMSSAPTGWLACDGSAVSRTTYSALFSAISTTWGVGDGSTTFNLPDLRGAFVRGAGSHGSETMADSNAYAGPAVGSYEDDQMQQITGKVQTTVSGLGQVGAFGTEANAGANGLASTSSSLSNYLTFDSADSTAQGGARTGDETRPFAAGVYYCIKT